MFSLSTFPIGEKSSSTPLYMRFKELSKPESKLFIFTAAIRPIETPTTVAAVPIHIPVYKNDFVMVWGLTPTLLSMAISGSFSITNMIMEEEIFTEATSTIRAITKINRFRVVRKLSSIGRSRLYQVYTYQSFDNSFINV